MNKSGLYGLIEAVKAKEKGIICITGISGEKLAYPISRLTYDFPIILIMTSTYEKAEKLEEYFSFYLKDVEINLFPEEERSIFSYEAKSKALSFRRISCLNRVLSNKAGIYIVPIMGAAKGMPSVRAFKKQEISLSIGNDVDLSKITESLFEMGYERTEMSELKGQFSIRGGILDIYPPDNENPYRVDLFDTEIDSLKIFDPMTQRSIKQLDSITVPPAVMKLDSFEDVEYIWNYFPDDCLIVLDDWDRICEERDFSDQKFSEALQNEEHAPQKEIFASMEEVATALMGKNTIITIPFSHAPKYITQKKGTFDISCTDAISANGRMDQYEKEVKRLLQESYNIHIACSTEERMKNLKSFSNRNEIVGNIEYILGVLPSGVYFIREKEAFISDNDIFRSTKKKRRRKKSKGRPIKAFTDLKKGDYVVHENHGIGRFIGIYPLVLEGKRRDYLKISYSGDDILYVPVEQMDLIQSYIGSGSSTPKVNKLGGDDWKKTKEKAQAAIETMAEELVKLTAERHMEKGHSFSPDTVWQHEFEEQFPYEETDNQLRCVEEIKKDMEMPFPMDRLLCGDVGFGKTEVAARAIFKCIMEGKQAALLVPTTILANQHYHTFLERFSKFPCNIDMLSRFRTDAQQKATIEKLAEGSLDIIIGTHRLLSKDIKFKDLGLLVIDEEQRFGVKHKEAIKFLKKNVDVLTLTATPIPRTLHMSLSGIRSMSTLEEAPEERYPVQTYVMEQDDVLIREIIMREIERGGQVFVVFNRVKGINQVAEGLRTLVPEAKVAVIHGQMNENRLEDIMSDFMEHEFDILVATTIIESGIDVPNANTLIVLDADNYGLAQLYQLRGRVGRSNKAAYAFLMYRKNKIISEVAEKRLRAIKDFTEFGAGFRIAMKDLEIRGAGNLLGTAQSGHMMMIGYELYCKMIDDAVKRLRGEKSIMNDFEVLLEIKVDAYISSDYIDDESLKLDMYKRIAEIRSEGDMTDVIDELLDRFGDIPKETLALMKVARIQSGCRKAGIFRVHVDAGKAVFDFSAEENGLKPEILIKLSEKYGMNIIINLSSKPFIKLPILKGDAMLDSMIEFLSQWE